MSTRCNILLVTSGATEFIYRHHDGYTCETGADLARKLRANPTADAFRAALFAETYEATEYRPEHPVYEETDCIHGDIEYLYCISFGGEGEPLVSVREQDRRLDDWTEGEEARTFYGGAAAFAAFCNVAIAEDNAYRAKHWPDGFEPREFVVFTDRAGFQNATATMDTARGCEEVGVDLFTEAADGESHTAIYTRLADGRRYSCRTVSDADGERVGRIVGAWEAKYEGGSTGDFRASGGEAVPPVVETEGGYPREIARNTNGPEVLRVIARTDTVADVQTDRPGFWMTMKVHSGPNAHAVAIADCEDWYPGGNWYPEPPSPEPVTPASPPEEKAGPLAPAPSVETEPRRFATVNRKAFREALRLCLATRAKGRGALPVLAGFLLEASGGVVTLSTTDGGNRTEVRIDAHVHGGDFACVIPYDLKRAKMGRAKCLALGLHGTPEAPTVSLLGVRYACLPAADFPACPASGEGEAFTVEAAPLKRVSGYVSRDALRPAMEGLYLDRASGHVVATDGHRLCAVPRDMGRGEGLILSPDGLPSLDGKDVTCTPSGAVCRLSHGRVSVFARVIDETYPSWEAVTPQASGADSCMTLRPSAVAPVVEKATEAANRRTEQVRVYKNGTLHVRADDFERETEARLDIATDGDGEPGTLAGGRWMGFNGRYLAGVLRDQQGAAVALYTSSPNRAALFVEPSPFGDVRTLLMPCLLNA